MLTSGFEQPTFRLQVERTNQLCDTGFLYYNVLYEIKRYSSYSMQKYKLLLFYFKQRR